MAAEGFVIWRLVGFLLSAWRLSAFQNQKHRESRSEVDPPPTCLSALVVAPTLQVYPVQVERSPAYRRWARERRCLQSSYPQRTCRCTGLSVTTTFFMRKWGHFISVAITNAPYWRVVFCRTPRNVFLLSVNERIGLIRTCRRRFYLYTEMLMFGPSVDAINESCLSDFKESPQLQLRCFELNILKLSSFGGFHSEKSMKNDFLFPPMQISTVQTSWG